MVGKRLKERITQKRMESIFASNSVCEKITFKLGLEPLKKKYRHDDISAKSIPGKLIGKFRMNWFVQQTNRRPTQQILYPVMERGGMKLERKARKSQAMASLSSLT